MNPEDLILIVHDNLIVGIEVIDREVQRDVKFVESTVVETDRKETAEQTDR